MTFFTFVLKEQIKLGSIKMEADKEEISTQVESHLILTRKFAALIIVAFGLRLLILGLHFPDPDWFLQPDSGIYISLAEQLKSTGDYGPHLIRPPGYPVLLSLWMLLGNSIHPVWLVILNLLLGVSTVVVTYLLSRQFLREPFALICATVIAVFPNQLFMSLQVLADLPFMLFYLLFLLSLLNYLDNPKVVTILYCGFTAGVGLLIKPVLGPLCLLCLIPLSLKCRNVPQFTRHCLIFLLCVGCVYGGWSVRNAFRTGTLKYSSPGSFNVLFITAAKVKAKAESITLAESQKEITRELEKQIGRKNQGLYDDVEFIQLYPKKSREILIKHIHLLPGVWMKSSIEFFGGTSLLRLGKPEWREESGNPLTRSSQQSLLNFVWHRISASGNIQPDSLKLFLTLGRLFEILTLVALCLGFLYGSYLWIRSSQVSILPFIFVFYLILVVNLLGIGYSRFRLPVEPLMLMIALWPFGKKHPVAGE